MTLNLSVPEQNELSPRIAVFGVGGAGGNAVNNMIEKNLDGVDFVVANTDAQALQQSQATQRIQLGIKVTEGLGAGARASVGAAAAEESIEQIVDHLAGSHMCFITAGMGGGTGTGAAPIIAQAARELGILTVGVVTKPFQFEGSKRMRQAEEGVEALQKMVDTLIIIPNQNLFRIANEKTTFTEAFSMADDVLYQGVKGVTDLMVRPGLINLDFADVRAVMDEMGKAMMGTGEAEGDDRAIKAAEKAIANPLLDEISLKGARGVLINITGGYDLTLFELDEAANRIREEVDPDANIIVGSTLDPDISGVMRVSVVATGIDATSRAQDIPTPRRTMAEPLAPASEAPFAAASESEAESATVVPTAAAVPSVSDIQASSAEASPEPSLFDEPVMQASNEQPLFSGEPQNEFNVNQAGSDIPTPAYQVPFDAMQPPQTSQQQVSALSSHQQMMRPEAGTPSQEAMDRLRAAVNHTPTQQSQYESEPEPAEAERPRFGIGSLINRMSGGQSSHSIAAQPQARIQPQVNSAPPAGAKPEDTTKPTRDDRIEVPAFLRRQAN